MAADWIIGICKVDDCAWVEPQVETDEWTSLRVTKAMVEHSEATSHPCTQDTYYADLQVTDDVWRASG